MTEPERQALRHAISEARRALVAETTALECEQCAAPMPGAPSNKRFCGGRCRTYWWYRNTERGRAALRAKKRRVYARGGGIAASGSGGAVNEREFLERVELTLRQLADTKPHAYAEPTLGKNGLRSHHVSAPSACERCRLERLADEAADRAMRATA